MEGAFPEFLWLTYHVRRNVAEVMRRVRLRVCAWYAVEVVKKRLIKARRYGTEKREKLVDLIHA